MKNFLLTTSAVLWLAAPSLAAAPRADTPLSPSTAPGNARAVDRQPGKFTFAVFSDLTGGERPGVFDIAVRQINLLRPDLVFSVGDLIEGADEVAELDRQWAAFESRAGAIRGKAIFAGGNHDLLGPEMRAAWDKRLGPRHFHFLYRDVLFIVLDTEDHDTQRLAEIARLRREAMAVAADQGWGAFGDTPYARLPSNKAGTLSTKQSAAVIAALEENPDVRWTFLFMHKAPWRHDDLPAWQAIENALEGRRYTVFHGHEHAYLHEVRGGADYIQLGTTGGVPLPRNGQAMDHLVLVTVDGDEVAIANLLMGGVLDATGQVPGHGHDRCYARTLCEDVAPD